MLFLRKVIHPTPRAAKVATKTLTLGLDISYLGSQQENGYNSYKALPVSEEGKGEVGIREATKISAKYDMTETSTQGTQQVHNTQISCINNLGMGTLQSEGLWHTMCWHPDGQASSSEPAKSKFSSKRKSGAQNICMMTGIREP